MRPLLRRLLLGLLVACAVLVAAEGIARLVYGAPVGLHVVEASASELVFEGDQLRVNAWLPDEPPVLVPLAPAGPRVLFVGGSSVHQAMPGREAEWPRRVSERLGVATVNLGSPGLDSAAVLGVVDDLGPVGHDVLVVYSGHNDFGNAFMRARFEGDGVRALSRARAALTRLRLFVLLDDAMAPQGRLVRRAEQVVPVLDDAGRERILARLETNLHAILDHCETRGVVPVLVAPTSNLLIPPSEQGCTPERCLPDRHAEAMALRARDPVAAATALAAVRDADWGSIRAPSEVGPLYARVAADRGVRLVVPDRDLPREPGLDVPRRDLFMDQLHFSVEGHRALGELVAPAVRAALAEAREEAQP